MKADSRVYKPSPRALLLVVSAPSGGGKTTLCRRLLARFPEMRYSISCTTRAPRGDEVCGRAYHFLTADEFRERIRRGEFLEHALVHGHFYGTPRAGIVAALRDGRDILLDIDVQGARNLRSALSGSPGGDDIRRAYTDVFLAPPSMTALEERLRARGQDAAETIAGRLRNARAEMEAAGEYRYLIVNDRIAAAEEALAAIVTAEHHRNPEIGETL